ncbi:hypothetical protein Mal65_20560 [Crateriforma conspicua]|nr:hypothetical protein Mal65_20560 [Crateriforma conspicua]
MDPSILELHPDQWAAERCPAWNRTEAVAHCIGTDDATRIADRHVLGDTRFASIRRRYQVYPATLPATATDGMAVQPKAGSVDWT